MRGTQMKNFRKDVIEKSNRQSGITLVALIVTIIIMVILAGVSINAIVGDNGIITNAIEAARLSDIADVKEQIQIALINKNSGLYTEDDILEIAKEITGNEVEKNEDGIYIVLTEKGNEVDLTDLFENVTSTYTILSSSDIAKNPETYYGAVVSNYTVADEDLQEDLDEEGIEWKIFYADDENIYLIASDYIPVVNAPANSNGSTPVYSGSYPYSLNLSNVYSVYSGASDITNNELIKWNSLYYNSYSMSTYTNMKYVAYLMDTSLWSDYANTNYATYAIGGTTLEMWVASWNQKGYTMLYCDNINSYGYYIGTSGTPTSFNQYVTGNYISNSGYDDTLYFSHQASWNSCNGYYLASPGQRFLWDNECVL